MARDPRVEPVETANGDDEPQSLMSDRALLRRVDDRSMETLHSLGAIAGELGRARSELAALDGLVQRFDSRIERVSTDMVDLKIEMREVGTAAKTALARIYEVEEAKRLSSPLPPAMRAEAASTMDAIEKAKGELTTRLREQARKTPGPQVIASPEQLATMAEEIIARMLTEREEALRVRADRDRLAAIDDATKRAAIDRRRLKHRLIVGVIVAAVGGAASAVGTYHWGHGQGEREGQSASPPPRP